MLSKRKKKDARSLGQGRFVDWLFGYDFFISYTRKDGVDYPRALAEELHNAVFSVFLDTREYVLGDELDTETERRVRMSQYLILLAGPHIHGAEWVSREVEVFRARGRTPIVIVMKDIPEEAVVDGKLIKEDWLRFTETQADAPSAETLEQLRRAFRRRRRDNTRRRVFAGAYALMTAVLCVGMFFWYSADQERRLQEASTAESLAARADLTLDNAEFEVSALLALTATAVRRDGIVTKSQRRIITEAAAVYFAATVKTGAPNSGMARAVAFSPDEDQVAVADNNGNILIAGVEDGTITKTLPLPVTYVSALATSPDGRFLIAGDDKGVLSWYDWRGLSKIRSLKAHGRSITDIAFAPHGKKFATGGYDNAVRIWDTETGNRLDEFRDITDSTIARSGEENAVVSLDYSPVEERLAVSSLDNTFQILDVERGEIVANFTDLPDSAELDGGWSHYVMALEFSPDGHTVSTGSVDGILRHWAPEKDGELKGVAKFAEPRVNMKRLSHFRYLRGGEYIALAYDSGDLFVLDAIDGAIVLRLAGTRWWTEDLVLSPSGRFLANAAGDGNAWIWDLKAISDPKLIERLCQKLRAYGVDLERTRRLMDEQFDTDVAAPTVCTPSHITHEFTPQLRFD